MDPSLQDQTVATLECPKRATPATAAAHGAPDAAQAAQRAAFAFASVDAALGRQRAAAAAKLEAEALNRAVEDRAAAEAAAAEAAAAEAAAAADHLRQERERAAAREEQLGRVRMLERQYRARLLLRCRDQWLCFVAAVQLSAAKKGCSGCRNQEQRLQQR